VVFVFWIVVALIAAGIHLMRHKDLRSRGEVAKVLLRYWLLVVIGIGSIFGAMFHIFDARETAENIGFIPWEPQSTGAFQFENAMGDLAIGIAAMMCFWIKDTKFWLAVIIISLIQFWGDAYGHIYQMVEYDNHAEDNTGAILVFDIVNPLVLVVLYWLMGHSGKTESASTT